MRHDIPEGSRETDFALGWLTWGRIRCGPWVHEWYLSVKRQDHRYLFVLDLEETAKGNLAFGRGNSWRGDEFEPAVRSAIAASHA